MKPIKTAKQLTFTYFSIVAFAIIVFHFSMFTSMIENVEIIYAENRMLKDKGTAVALLNGTQLTHVSVPPFSEVYVGKENLPAWVVLNSSMTDDKPYELDDESDTPLEIFSMRSKVRLNGEVKDLYVIHYDEIYEISEEQMFETQSTQLALSLLLLIISLWVVMRISGRLTQPLAQLSKSLGERRSNNLSAITLPQGAATREIHQLVERLNDYQDQIRDLIERERAFNRYASHELRTPLMVMKGATTLLGKSDSKVFLERQRVRMVQACQEMEDYITTLLSLTREEDLDAMACRVVPSSEYESIRQTHLGYIMGKKVVVNIIEDGQIITKLPIPTLHILVGNLLKNAMACTEDGHVNILVTDNELAVVDTGCGLSGQPGGESYGLGLMIVRDICAKYHCTFSLEDNKASIGCTATVVFPSAF
ncbi:HAMP domain-containing histidine kinase [Marinomonas sp. M1K-6]|uniref:histidine kinase n=1 Tax=Marinomonas profundi TaxID=2726122 RepID=A0A847QXI4_9GAMM|nr:HAMP domain-containing sensor histidine kinase [Marinomonas profundi]NLQ18438.1 HAMP domain-containing histidine kinase [Marinomonas profundi]UDV02759.1 HAMP domain-containing histidine kinase [Marinomonas profundi]